jgi:hypothetical protein
LVDWRITAEVLQTAEANFRQASLPIAPPLQAPQVVPQVMPVAAPQEPRQSFVQLNYLRCTEQGNKSIADSRLFFRQSMDRLSLTDVPYRKWVPYLLTFMNETDRIWAEQNIEMETALLSTSREEVQTRFVNPFLEADNGPVTHRTDVLEFHGYGWEKSKLPYLAFMKEISVMSGKANIPDDDVSSILLFIEKQPTEIRVGLNNLAVTKGGYTSLRTMFRDATSLSTSYDKFLQPAYSRDVPRSNAQPVLKTLSTPVTRKPTDGPCRQCAELGKSVVWTREHWNKEHPQFSKSLVPRKRTLNNIEEVQQEADSELRECFWEMFSVEEEEENKQASNYSPLPHTPVTINGNLCTALVF